MAGTKVLQNKRWIIPIAHFLGWLLFFSIPFFSHNEHKHLDQPFLPPPMPEKDTMLYLSLFTNIIMVVVFYLNISVIAPLFTREKKYGKYFLIQFAAALFFYFFIKSITFVVLSTNTAMPLVMELFNYMIVILVSLCYSLINENIRVERLQKEKENETLRTELSFLRWQISPHFLFNVLNNMVALARSRSDKLEGMLLNLSNLMRYMLYETDEQKVSIEREAEYLKSYIDLQNLRFGTEVTVISNIYISEKTNDGDVIEPMLLIPFIENAFKHGIGTIVNPVIDIHVHFEPDMLTMTVRNKYRPVSEERKDDTKGIGLTNVNKRLKLLYPLKHSLSVDKKDGWYISTLGINLS